MGEAHREGSSRRRRKRRKAGTKPRYNAQANQKMHAQKHQLTKPYALTVKTMAFSSMGSEITTEKNMPLESKY